MFTVFLDRTHRVLLSCFTGTFTLDAIAECDRAVMLILGREGPVHGIIDLTEVDAVDIATDALKRRAQQPPMMAGQRRVFVAATPATRAFVEAYTALHHAFGSIGLQIAGTRADAYLLLGLKDPAFEPMHLA